MFVSVRDRQGDERRNDLQLEAHIRVRGDVDAHLLGLTVDRLHRATIGSDVQPVARACRTRLLATSRDEPNAGDRQQTGGIGGVDAILVADELRVGKFVIIVEDEDREHEGDLAIVAEYATRRR